MKAQIGLLIAAALLMSGCNLLLVTENPTQDLSAGAATAAPTPTTRPEAEGTVPMTTHVDKQSGVAFDYPSDWTLIIPDTEGALVYSYSMASFNLTDSATSGDKSESGVPINQTKIDVTFFGTTDTIDTALGTLQADVNNGFAIVKDAETRVRDDGSTAYYYTINGRLGGIARVMYASVNGRVIGVVAYGDLQHFEAVAASLRAV